jgi:hypothetical protein
LQNAEALKYEENRWNGNSIDWKIVDSIIIDRWVVWEATKKINETKDEN